MKMEIFFKQFCFSSRSATTVSSTSSHFLRPKSLAISSGLVKIWRKERSRPGNQNSGNNADISGTSCPTGSRSTVRRKSDRKSVPLIRYDFVSAPSTPNSETDTLWMDSKHSVSTEVIPEIEKRSKRSGETCIFFVESVFQTCTRVIFLLICFESLKFSY